MRNVQRSYLYIFNNKVKLVFSYRCTIKFFTAWDYSLASKYQEMSYRVVFYFVIAIVLYKYLGIRWKIRTRQERKREKEKLMRKRICRNRIIQRRNNPIARDKVQWTWTDYINYDDNDDNDDDNNNNNIKRILFCIILYKSPVAKMKINWWNE